MMLANDTDLLDMQNERGSQLFDIWIERLAGLIPESWEHLLE